MAFGRVVKVYFGRFDLGNLTEKLGDGEAFCVQNLDMEFEIERSIEYWNNTASLTIWNASPSTIERIMYESPAVIIQAGYEDETIGNIFVGQVGLVKSERDQEGGVKTNITCVSNRGAYYQLAMLGVDVRFSKEMTYKQCLEELCNYAQIALRCGIEDDLNQAIGEPFAASGDFLQVVDEFNTNVLFPNLNRKIYRDNNEMIVYGAGKEKGVYNKISMEEINLNFDTGLIRASEIKSEKDNKINAGADPYYIVAGADPETIKNDLVRDYVENAEPNKQTDAVIDTRKRIQITALLSPKFMPNVFIHVDARYGDEYDDILAIKGYFQILSVVFSGSNFGSNFSATCECLEITDD